MSKLFKVSYVVVGEEHPGAILSTSERPQKGELVKLGGREFTVVEVIQLIPPRGDFDFLHVTLQPVNA